MKETIFNDSYTSEDFYHTFFNLFYYPNFHFLPKKPVLSKEQDANKALFPPASTENDKRNSASFWPSSTDMPNLNAKKNHLLALNPLLCFKDGSCPVFYQEKNPVILIIMTKREEKLTPLENSFILEDGYLPVQPTYAGLTLIHLSDNKWAIHDGLSNKQRAPIAGISYAFVTMPDKNIRITTSEMTVHLMISNASPVVRYAGNLMFNEHNKIEKWDNRSGAYRPLPELAHQAGFYAEDINTLTDDIAKLNSTNTRCFT